MAACSRTFWSINHNCTRPGASGPNPGARAAAKMNPLYASVIDELAFSLRQTAVGSPPLSGERLKARADLLTAIARRSEKKAEMLLKVLSPQANEYPSTVSKLLGASWVNPDTRSDTALSPELAGALTRVGSMDAGKIVALSTIGPITRWTINLKDILNRIWNAEKVLLTLDSTGGDAALASDIYDILRLVDTEVTIFGSALSAAAVVAMAGKKRRISRDGGVMVHARCGVAAGPPARLRFCADNAEETNERPDPRLYATGTFCNTVSSLWKVAYFSRPGEFLFINSWARVGGLSQLLSLFSSAVGFTGETKSSLGVNGGLK